MRRDLNWLSDNLNEPDILSRSGHHRAICWYKDKARAPISVMWSIKQTLESYGYWVDVLKTSDPGLVIYEDGWQVAAKPHRKRLRERR